MVDLRLREPLWFLLRFAVVTAVLFLAREPLSAAYAALTVPVVNGCMALGDLPARYLREGHQLWLVYPPAGFRLQVHDIIYQNLIVAVGLFAASPGHTPGWRCRWLAIVLGVLWTSHVASLYMGGTVMLWDVALDLPPAERQRLVGSFPASMSAERDWLLSRLFGWWHTWGRPAAGLLLWVYAEVQARDGADRQERVQ